MGNLKERKERIKKLIARIRTLIQNMGKRGSMSEEKATYYVDALDEYNDEVDEATDGKELREIVKAIIDLLKGIP